jgi:hypothetical protein
MRIRSVSAVALLVITLLAACGGDDSSSTANTTTTFSNTHLDVETPDGQVSVALNGKLPPGWPSDFPIPKGASPAGSGSLVNGEKGGRIGVYTSSQAPADAFDFYKSNDELTVTASASAGTGDKYVGTIQLGGSTPGNITIVSSEGKTYIVVTLKSESSSTTTT